MSKTYFKMHTTAKEGRSTYMDILFAMMRSLVPPQQDYTIPYNVTFDLNAESGRLEEIERQLIKPLPETERDELLKEKEARQSYVYFLRAFVEDWVKVQFPGWEDLRNLSNKLTVLSWAQLGTGIQVTMVIGEAGHHFAFLNSHWLNEISNFAPKDLKAMQPRLEVVAPQSTN